MSVVLSAASILASNDLAIHEEPVPEWSDANGEPGVVRLRQLSAADTIKLTDDIQVNRQDGMYIILVYCAVDAENKPIFTMDDISALRTKNMRVLDRLQRAALRVNAMGAEIEAALKKV